eukprot:1826445-Ditylum_brightwellii.AAC.1
MSICEESSLEVPALASPVALSTSTMARLQESVPSLGTDFYNFLTSLVSSTWQPTAVTSPNPSFTSPLVPWKKTSGSSIFT